MSSVYFHTEKDTVHISGSERSHCGLLCSDLALAVLRVRFDDKIRSLVSPGSYVRDRAIDFTERFSTSFHVDMEFLLPDGRKTNAFHVGLNTALAIGNDVIRLAALLHGQCELHGYIEGPHRAQYADVIEQGLELKILRRTLRGYGMGWDRVIKLLRSDANSPIVTSYSVCEGFPSNTGLCKHCDRPRTDHHVNKNKDGSDPWFICITQPTDVLSLMNRFEEHDEKSEERWYELPKEEQWARAMDRLRSEPQWRLEWNPETWHETRIDGGITAMEIREIADNLPDDLT